MTPERFLRAARAVLLVTGLLFLVCYAVAAIGRMSYPYELELMEGDFLIEVGKILSGKPLYAAPTLDSASLVYAPLYFYISALFVKLFGARLFSLRLLSFVSSLGCFSLVYAFVRRETGSRFFGALSGCLLAATFGATGFWFDLGRPDSMYLLFSLAGAYLARFHERLLGAFLSGVAFLAAFLTKQTALLIFAPLLAYFALLGRRELAVFAATVGGLGGAALAFFQHASSGWFFYYVFQVPSTVLTSKKMILLFWCRQVLPLFGMAVVFALYFFLSASWGLARKKAAFYSLFALGMVGASWLYSLNWGAYLNGLIPIAAVLCILAGLGAHAALSSLELLTTAIRPAAEGCLWGMLFIQFACLVYNPFLQIPGKADLEAGRSVAARIAQIPGRVFIPYHTSLYMAAGKEPAAHLMNIRFLLAAPRPAVAAGLREEITDALRRRTFSAVIVDRDLCGEALPEDFRDELLANYDPAGAFSYTDNFVFREKTGLLIRPEVIYRPKRLETESSP